MSPEKLEVPPPKRVAFRVGRISVNNFGPVRSADLDLNSDLTFIMGPGNSGKTWLASLAYSLTRQAGPWLLNRYLGIAADVFRERGIVGQVSRDALLGLARDQAQDLVQKYARDPSVRVLPNSLPAALGVSNLSDLIRVGEPRAEILVDFSLGGQAILTYQITLERSGQPTVEITPLPDSFSTVVTTLQPQLTVMAGGGWGIQYAALSLAGARYIPAERLLFIPIFTSYLSLILGLSQSRGQPFGVPGAVGFQPPQFRQTHLDFLADLGGVLADRAAKGTSLKLLEFGDLEVRPPKVYFKDSRRGATVDIAAAASGVAQVAGMMSIGEADPPADTLFVEEPELNLHADAQIRVANYLAQLSARSRVVVTTHSQYIATMLAIALGKGSIRSLKGYYLDPQNDSAEEMLIQPDTGMVALPKSIERALEEIGEAAAELNDSD
jgi:hypothetical protein